MSVFLTGRMCLTMIRYNIQPVFDHDYFVPNAMRLCPEEFNARGMVNTLTKSRLYLLQKQQ